MNEDVIYYMIGTTIKWTAGFKFQATASATTNLGFSGETPVVYEY